MSTPLMLQYKKIKESHPDSLLLFRMGDFYETFEDDAKIASKVLGITLTKRANGAAGEVPLAGFPHHAIDNYLPKLIRAGYRVAVCEQTENPKFAKGIVKREVTEIVTPGVTFSEKILDHKKNNYILAITIIGESAGFSFCDISTAEFSLFESEIKSIKENIELINPSEILISKKYKSNDFKSLFRITSPARITYMEDWIFSLEYAQDLLKDHFKTVNLKGFGIDLYKLGIISSGLILHYLKENQLMNLNHLNKISYYNSSNYMTLDNSTKRNLEIIYSMIDGTSEGSLISILDNTLTPMGSRLLKKWISAPLKKLDMILNRQEAVDELFRNKEIRKRISEQLDKIGDIERLISKICSNKSNPRDLINLKSSLHTIPLLKNLLENSSSNSLVRIKNDLQVLDKIIKIITDSIIDEPSLNINDGGVMKYGYNPELDELRDLSRNAKNWIANLQKSERERTSISSLKVSYNKVFGYYIEISNANKDKVPDDYIRKQTLVNGERYITPELKVYEDKILNAEEKISELENQLFNEIRLSVASETESIQNNARLIGMLDCFYSFAESAEKYNYIKPMINESDKINIQDGRHPVVERILSAGEKFTPNDCNLSNSEDQIIIITGPNMAGKSVYLRQIGLIILMAQIGSFVPAKYAEIGIVDRIFTRVGASDNITAGESTFLVEMQEAANILNSATSNSLILLDEIGRGTSTFDGLSIAWAICEYLHDNSDVSAKTLFATHYHELNELENIFPRIKNYKVEVREYKDKVIFLHKVSRGYADHSYGIQVAQMAGLPFPVTNRAKDILLNLENKELTPIEIKKAKLEKIQIDSKDLQFNLFEFKDDEIRKELKEVNVNNLTPVEALNKLNELKQKMESRD